MTPERQKTIEDAYQRAFKSWEPGYPAWKVPIRHRGENTLSDWSFESFDEVIVSKNIETLTFTLHRTGPGKGYLECEGLRFAAPAAALHQP
jgi:hypothetical protein